jgi:hypothetical protein
VFDFLPYHISTASGQTLLWQEVKHSYGRKSNTLMAASQKLLYPKNNKKNIKGLVTQIFVVVSERNCEI